MKHSKITLRDAFIEDHKHLTRGLNRLLRALREDDLETGIDIARELDRVAGPHIQFEEEVLYPEISRSRGADFTNRLYQEHSEALQAIRTLLSAQDSKVLPPEVKQKVIKDAETGLSHAVSCGTLLSHLTTLPPELQDKLLQRLLQLREDGRRWSEL